MKISTVIVIVVLVAVAKANDPTSICKLAPDFGAVGNQTIAPLPKDAKFCRNLNKTCCSPEDFQTMWSIWQDPKRNDSLRSVRMNQMKTMIQVVRYMKEADQKLIVISNIIKQSQINADPACGTPAYIQRQLHKLAVADTAVKQFTNTGKRCWKFTKNLMNGLMCAACDAEAQDYIDYKKKELFITNEMCDTFLTECGEHLKAIQAIYFYFDVYARLTYCDLDGKFSIHEVPRFINFPKSVSEAINGCMNNKRRDDCTVVCQSQLGFTTMTNFEFEKRDTLDQYRKKVKDYITKMTAEVEKRAKMKAEEKKNIFQRRILEKAKDIEETIARLNLYKIKLAPKGLNFTHYVKDDVDGYQDIKESDIFESSRIPVFVMLWVLSLFALN